MSKKCYVACLQSAYLEVLVGAYDDRAESLLSSSVDGAILPDFPKTRGILGKGLSRCRVTTRKEDY